jgi:hypothetical protein
MPPPTSPPPTVPPTAPPAANKVIIRAKEVICDLLRTKLIHAKELSATESSIGQLIESDSKTWEMERRDGKVEMSEIIADEVYAKEVRCRRIEAAVAYAQEAKLGSR